MSLSTTSNKSSTVELKSEKTLKTQLSVLYSRGLRTAASYQDLESTKSVAALSVLTRPVERLMIMEFCWLWRRTAVSLMEKTPLINGRKSAFLITLNHSLLGQTLATFELSKNYVQYIWHSFFIKSWADSGFGFILTLSNALSDMYIWLSLIQWHFSGSEREISLCKKNSLSL